MTMSYGRRCSRRSGRGASFSTNWKYKAPSRVAALSAKIATAAATAGLRRSCSLKLAFIAISVMSATLLDEHPASGVGGCTLPIPGTDASPEARFACSAAMLWFAFARA